GYLSILKDIYTNVVIPQAVANELANLTEEDIRIKAIISLNWIQVKQASNLELVACLSNDYNLDIGEAEAIAGSSRLCVIIFAYVRLNAYWARLLGLF
ncbi:hypothetical protein PN434_03330, partial [Microcystis aeruginosa CS-558/01A06]|nr:hypothetical protein [Microcystis aeruginosa CS-558/01A06]